MFLIFQERSQTDEIRMRSRWRHQPDSLAAKEEAATVLVISEDSGSNGAFVIDD